MEWRNSQVMYLCAIEDIAYISNNLFCLPDDKKSKTYILNPYVRPSAQRGFYCTLKKKDLFLDSLELNDKITVTKNNNVLSWKYKNGIQTNGQDSGE